MNNRRSQIEGSWNKMMVLNGQRIAASHKVTAETNHKKTTTKCVYVCVCVYVCMGSSSK